LDFTYDIFRTFPGDDPMWVEAVTNLEEAQERLHTLPKIEPSEYLLFDSHAGKFIESLMEPSQPLSSSKNISRAQEKSNVRGTVDS
jgi:hypothetical protein